MVHLRTLCGTAPLYYDPSLWSADDSTSTVHRHMVPSLFCVPSVGAPIMDLPQQHLDIVRDWLAFYRRHQPVLNAGRFQALWAGGDYQALMADRGQRRVAAVFSRHPLALDGRRETWLINAASDRIITTRMGRAGRAVIEDAAGRACARPRRIGKGLQEITCPTGRVIHVEFD